MLTESALINLEKKYFDILSDLLNRSIGQIIAQIYSQNSITGATVGGVTNVIEAAVENVIEALIANQLHWNICSLPVSADSCFECGDAIVHIDAKTVVDTDNDNRNNKVNVEAAQTTYVKDIPLTISRKLWEPKLKLYESHTMFGTIPNLTYIVKVVYSSMHLVEKIKLISLPHGQLYTRFGADILQAGKSTGTVRTNIRFQEEKISAIDSWRVFEIYTRQ